MRIIKEPLFHFILIGAVFFGLYAVKNQKSDAGGMVVSSQKITVLVDEFSSDWNREPSAEEVQILIEDYVREELAFREGLALGLKQNDVIIRQRIRQKLELMVEEEAMVQTPTDAELAEYLNQHADLFQDENGQLPKLDQIRNLVLFEWENQLRLEQLDRFYAELEVKYDVQIEGRQ